MPHGVRIGISNYSSHLRRIRIRHPVSLSYAPRSPITQYNQNHHPFIFSHPLFPLPFHPHPHPLIPPPTYSPTTHSHSYPSILFVLPIPSIPSSPHSRTYFSIHQDPIDTSPPSRHSLHYLYLCPFCPLKSVYRSEINSSAKRFLSPVYLLMLERIQCIFRYLYHQTNPNPILIHSP